MRAQQQTADAEKHCTSSLGFPMFVLGILGYLWLF